MHAVLLTNVVATLFMTGLIWFVQVVHYPLFGAVGEPQFPAYSRSHQIRTTFVVAPAMLLEALSSLLLAIEHPTGSAGWLAWTGLALLAAIWLSTATLQVPAHGRLAGGFDRSVAQRLVRTNWIRTVGWSARAGVVVAMLAESQSRGA